MKTISLYLFCLLLLVNIHVQGQQQVLLYEDFEATLNPLIDVQSVGLFGTDPGIRSTTVFGSMNGFGFGYSICPGSCFNFFTSTLTITFTAPTYVDSIKFSEMELSGNWGSEGEISLDGVPFPGGLLTGALPYNSWVADSVPHLHAYSIKQVVTTISFFVHDITYASEIVIDDLYITTFCDIAVNSQPVSQTLVAGNSAAFITQGSIPSATYQWQTDTGSGFQDVVNGGQYSGATDDTLIVSNTSPANDNQTFRCVISYAGCFVTTDVVSLSITTGMEDIYSHNTILTPTLINDLINVSPEGLAPLRLTIYDVRGMEVFAEEFHNSTTLDCSRLSKAMYIYEIRDDEGVVEKGKLIRY